MFKCVVTTVTAGAIGCLSAFASAQPCPGLHINEVRIDQFGPDNDEFVELAGAPGASLGGITLVVIGDVAGAPSGQQSGGIELALNLTGGSLDANGLYVVAKTTFTLGTPNLAINPGTLVGGELLENSDNITLLLVQGFTGTLNQDLDTNNDGTLDITPWTSIVHSLSIIEDAAPNGVTQEFFYSAFVVGPDGIFSPFHVWVCADECEGNIGDGDIGIDDSPGAANDTCGKGGGSDELVINEIRIDHTGTDTDEYLELAGPPGTSLSGMSLVVIGDGTPALLSGVVERVISLDTFSIQADGFFLIADDKFGMILDGTPDLTITGADLFENGDNLTFLLVSGATPAAGDDLDANNDGTLDTTPWTSVVDGVAMILQPNPPTSTEFEYATSLGFPTVGPEGTNVPGHVYLCSPDQLWTIGQFNPAGGQDTPDAENTECGLIAPCGSALAGSCFTVHAGPNCNNAECCTAVCAIDPDCCNVAWDEACVTQALVTCQSCGDPLTGSCFEPDATPYCNDAACCETVCKVDPSCCQTEWDQLCADAALEFCQSTGRAPEVIINEIRTDQVGGDNDEYFELRGKPGTSLDGVTYLVIGDGAGSGTVEVAISLTGNTIPVDGHFLATESTFVLAVGAADLTLTGGNPINFENADNVTHMLVFNFTGSANQDLDTDDDGTLDATPWETEMDRIALVLQENPPTTTEFHYGPPQIGPDIDKKSKAPFAPSQVWRCQNTGAWNLGTFDPAEGVDTPGAANASCKVAAEGACCLGVECVFTDPDSCAKSKGTYLGDGTECDKGACAPSCPNPNCAADINGDTIVNGIDLGIMLLNFSQPISAPGCAGALPCCSDLNGNGTVDGVDLGILLLNFTGQPGGDPDCL